MSAMERFHCSVLLVTMYFVLYLTTFFQWVTIFHLPSSQTFSRKINCHSHPFNQSTSRTPLTVNQSTSTITKHSAFHWIKMCCIMLSQRYRQTARLWSMTFQPISLCVYRPIRTCCITMVTSIWWTLTSCPPMSNRMNRCKQMTLARNRWETFYSKLAVLF